MKLLQFLIILGVFWKGHCTLDTKLLTNYHINRKLLVAGGANSTATGVAFSDACSVTRINNDLVVAATGPGVETCEAPGADGKCDDNKQSLTDGQGVHDLWVYSSAGEGAPELADDAANYTDCKAIGWGDDGKQGAALTEIDVTVAADEEPFLKVSSADPAKMCSGDNGGAILCGGKLAGVIAGLSGCETEAKAVKAAALTSAGGNATGGDTGGDGGTTHAPGGDGTIISLTTFIMVFPIIIIVGFFVN